jgi:2-methylcitrate dehydratase PrpD
MTPMSSSTDLSILFAEAIANTRFDRLPAPAVDAAKKSVLDTLGVILAASGMEAVVHPLLELIKEFGGSPESSLFGVGGRVPAPAAALVNGAMAHCLDFDDRTPRGRHSGSSLVPAAIALAERRRDVSGRSFLAAVAAGQDLFMRLRCNVGDDETWNLSTVLGVLSATATASSVLGLDAARTANALAIASTQASGTMQLVHAASPLRATYAGFTAQSAVMSSLMAQRDMAGIEGALEGPAGLFTACFQGRYDREEMLEGLGTTYLGSDMGYKPWPVVGLAHPHIHAIIQLMKRHHLAAADVDLIRVYVSPSQHQICTPLDRRRAPQNAMEAKFSLPYGVALAAAHGGIAVSHFKPEALTDPTVLALASKVMPIEDTGPQSQPAVGRVQLVTRDGRTFDQLGTDVPGSPQAPMTWDDIAHKFVGCAGVAALPLPAANAQRVVEMVARLDELDDVTELVQALR